VTRPARDDQGRLLAWRPSARRGAGVRDLLPGARRHLTLVVAGTSSTLLFVATTGLILSFYGGGFATVPAYLKDMFGGYQVGAIHGRLLTAWSAAGVAGPLIVNAVADAQTNAGQSGADLFPLSLSIMVGVLVVGFVATALMRPVDPRFHRVPDEQPAERPLERQS
jgi:hypothetical protein